MFIKNQNKFQRYAIMDFIIKLNLNEKMCCLSLGILWGHKNDSKVSIKNINEVQTVTSIRV